jgi:hypothetical protein
MTIDLWKSRITAHLRWKTRGDFCLQTYIERDVRDVVNVGDLETFSRFFRLCAG